MGMKETGLCQEEVVDGSSWKNRASFGTDFFAGQKRRGSLDPPKPDVIANWPN